MDGLWGRCTLYKRVDRDDEGTVVTDDSKMQENLSIRPTILDTGEKEEITVAGTSSEKMWRFSTAVPTETLVRTILYVIEFEGLKYDSLWWQYRRDEHGNIDHVEWRMELRDNA